MFIFADKSEKLCVDQIRLVYWQNMVTSSEEKRKSAR